jgi:AraC family transcriptional regulator, arabinose operon regulatory protein
MDGNDIQFQKDFLVNLQLNIITASYTHCWENWSDFDYTPDYNKFYFICGGEGLIKIGNVEYYPKEGQMVLMPAGIVQSYSTINKNTFKKYWCHFTAKIGDINLFDFFDVPYLVKVEDSIKLKNLFEELVLIQENQTLYSIFKEKAILTEIISYYIEKAKVNNLKFSKFSTIEKLNSSLKYIQDHISENITVEALANFVHFHPNYFTNIFKKHMGISPIQYINKIKFEKAKYFLKTTDLHINEIAERTGFCDIYYFSKSFKSYSGYSPSDFRNI